MNSAKLKLLCVAVIVCLDSVINTEATKCQPHSSFKVDCDVCFCSNDGTKYSCTTIPKCTAKIYNKENDVATTKHVRHTREEPSDTNYNQYLDDLTYEYLETEDDDYSKVKSGEVDDLEENLKNEA